MLTLLPQRRRHQLWRLAALMTVAAFADLFAIGTLLPFLAVLSGTATVDVPAFLLPLTRMSVWSAAGVFAGFTVLAGILRLVLAWTTQSFAVGTGHDIACEVQRRILLQPYSYHLGRHSSSAMAALQKVEELVWSLLLPLTEGIVALTIGSAIVVALLLVDPVAATIALAGVLLLYGAVIVATRPALKRSASVMNAGWEERVRLLGDSLGGIRDIIIDGSQALFLSLFRSSDARLARARARVALLSSAPRFIIEAIGLVLIAVAAAFLADRSGGLSAALPLLGALALAAQRLLPLLQQLYRGWAALTSRREVVNDIHALLTLPLPMTTSKRLSALPFSRELRLASVSFGYEGSRAPVLTDINLAIRKGSRVALTGKTGAGKSTLADICMGLLPPTSGDLLVDGQVLEQQDWERWRRNVAHVPQTVFLVDDTLRANIAFGLAPSVVDTIEVKEAAAMAQLTDLLTSLPEGLDTRIGERGIRLSGGQRQRLGLARAIYRKSPLLVLDEATNALDMTTEKAVLRSLDLLQDRGTTIIIIAHRSSALSGCDQVFQIDGGRLQAGTAPHFVAV